jgi:hypothetical protein
MTKLPDYIRIEGPAVPGRSWGYRYVCTGRSQNHPVTGRAQPTRSKAEQAAIIHLAKNHRLTTVR